jgi:DNA-binding transcriptional LysR family regulator
MSRALERLRVMFGDFLLVRTGRTYERTVRGERVLRELEKILPRVEAMVRGSGFDPSTSEQRFRIALTDHASTVLLPPVVSRVRRAAPRATIDVAVWSTRSYEDAAAGRIDSALSAEEPPPALESEVIFSLDFVCLVGSRERIRTEGRFTLKDYLGLPHILVESLAGQQTLVDRPLAQLGVKRRVVLSLPYFVSAIHAVAHTDLVLTAPRRLAKRRFGMTGVRVIEPPREIKAYPYFMAWHPRLTEEPAHRWFRDQLRTEARRI